MSAEDVPYFTKSRIASLNEQKILKEILLLYREHRCLWDNRNEHYNNKEVREQAFNLLLEKYRIIDNFATQADLRKRIDNLRCTYKRQHKRVLLSKLKRWDYRPTLWYYHLLTFLDENDDSEETIEASDLQDDEVTGEESDLTEAQNKKRKLEEPGETSSPEPKQQDDKYSFNNHEDNIVLALSDNEAEAFGSSIALQLKDLEPTQRYIAEKMISEVIFYGRLEKLNPQTCITLNNTDEEEV